MGKHDGQARKGEHGVHERAAATSLGIASTAASPQWWSARAAWVAACDQTCLRDPTFDAVNRKHQARHGRLQGELAWRAGVQDRRRHLSIASAATSRDMVMRMMALALPRGFGHQRSLYSTYTCTLLSVR